MKHPLNSRRRYLPEERVSLIQAYLASGLTQKQFAAEASISVPTLQNWLRFSARDKSGLPPSTPCFVELKPVAHPAAVSREAKQTLMLHFPSGLKVEWSLSETSLPGVLRLLQAL